MHSSRPALTQSGCRQGGFTYLGLIIMVTVIGLAASAALLVGAINQKRQAEDELLQIGTEYITALKRYAAATPAGQSTLPNRLEDLLLDPRYPAVRRYLRRLYIDPLTGKNAWGVERGTVATGTGIIGIYSLSEAKPIKIDNFDPELSSFKGKKFYREWIFTAQAAPAQPGDAVDQPPGTNNYQAKPRGSR